MDLTNVTPLQKEIAAQVHVQKPEHLVPGVHVGFEFPDDNLSLDVLLRDDVLSPTRRVRISYVEGADLYEVTMPDGEVMGNVYCDDLGRILFGEDAVEFIPEVKITDWEGNPI